MKKRIMRIVSVLMLCTLLCTSLCGCDIAAERSVLSAVVVDQNTIEWDGVIYKRIPYQLYSEIKPYGLNTDCSVYLNDGKTPTVMLPRLGIEFYPTDNRVFLRNANYTMLSDRGGEYNFNHYYCREDRYDDVMYQLQNGLNLTGYLYDYKDFGTGEYGIYWFSAEEIDAFNSALKAGEPCSFPYGYDTSLIIHPCTTDGLLPQDSYDILWKEEQCYIVHYTAYYYENNTMQCYCVPDEYCKAFAKLQQESERVQTYRIDFVG